MGSRLMFHTFATFMLTLLIFSMSSDTLAQQDSEQTEVPEIAAAEDVKTVRLTAKAAAEQDANSDTNKLLWFGTGVGIGIVGSAVGGCTGCVVGSILNPEVDPYIPLPNTEQMVGTLAGSTIGCLVPLIGIYNYSSANPPPERLLGKSPEYVEFYTDAYIKKTRLVRIQWAVAGTAASCGVAMLVGLIP